MKLGSQAWFCVQATGNWPEVKTFHFHWGQRRLKHFKYDSKPGEHHIEPAHQCCSLSLTKLSSGRGERVEKAIREVDILMGVLAGVSNLAPPIWGLLSWGENQEIIARGSHVEMKYLCLQVGDGRVKELPCLFISLLGWLLGVTLIWLTPPQKPLSPSILLTAITHRPVLHQWWAATNTNIFTVRLSNPNLPMQSASSSLSPFFSHPTPSIPISLALNSPCVPVTLKRVWGWSQPPVPLNGFFLNVHTLWPDALYSNCVKKTSDGEDHRRHKDIP